MLLDLILDRCGWWLSMQLDAAPYLVRPAMSPMRGCILRTEGKAHVKFVFRGIRPQGSGRMQCSYTRAQVVETDLKLSAS